MRRDRDERLPTVHAPATCRAPDRPHRVWRQAAGGGPPLVETVPDHHAAQLAIEDAGATGGHVRACAWPVAGGRRAPMLPSCVEAYMPPPPRRRRRDYAVALVVTLLIAAVTLAVALALEAGAAEPEDEALARVAAAVSGRLEALVELGRLAEREVARLTETRGAYDRPVSSVLTPAPAADPPSPDAAPPAAGAATVWDRLAACESHGDWGYGPHSGWGSGQYEGGVQFHPGTWDAYRDPGMPDAAYKASREVQIVVAERVLAAQGWTAWPACSRKLGLR